MNPSPARNSRGVFSISLDRRFLLAVALLTIGYLAWNVFDAVRGLALDAPWQQNLFLVFIATAYGFFLRYVAAGVLHVTGFLGWLRTLRRREPSA